ncbi:MAG: AraC family transcriptional regulator [Provencibacterium sp.]|nr:AraC family transcriptional regulator [Provencibacterium sp.]
MIVNRGYRDINPRCCGEERCPPEYRYGPAIREHYLLHYVVSGKGVFEARGAAFPVRQGQIFIIRPGETTTYQADRNDPWFYRWIGFESGIELPLLLRQPVLDAPQCGHLFSALVDSENLQSGRELYLCGKIYELLSLLSASSSSGSARDYVLRAKNYIESNYIGEITVRQMAGFLGLDRSYFSALFRSQTGRSPQDYLVELRLQKAAELIAVYGYRPGEAAAGVGYRDVCNFSRMFKRRFGVSPSSYGKGR